MHTRLAHTLIDDEVHMTGNNGKHSEAVKGKSIAQDSAMNSSRRLPDIPWKYNPPAPAGAVRPKPVLVPKSK
jgi:hypothetical protein